MGHFFDPFNRADNVDPGPAYESGYTNAVSCQIVGERLRANSTTQDSLNTSTHRLPPDQYGELTITTASGGTATYPRIILRFSTPPRFSGYEFIGAINDGAVKSRIRRWTNGSSVNLITNNTTPWAVGDRLRGEARGTLLSLYRNGSLVFSFEDGVYRAGRAGIMLFSNPVGDSDVDNFLCGPLTRDRASWPMLAAL